jgi:hypothetical protein
MSPASHPRLDRWLSIGAAAIVFAVVAATVAMWITAPSGPPSFELEVHASAERVEVDVSNVGGRLATEVVVRATFADGTEVDQTVTWLSPGETNSVVFLPGDQSSDVDVQVMSYAPND